MAHSKALARPIIVQMPRRAGGRARRAVRRVGHVARRAAHHARGAAPTTGILLGALGLGYAKQKGFLKKIPVIGGNANLSMFLAGYATRRFLHNPIAKNVGMAAMIVSAYSFGVTQAGGVSGEEGEEGDDGTFGDDAAV